MTIETIIPEADVDYYDNLETPAPMRFFSTKKGYAIDKKTLFGRVIVPVKDNPFLPELPFEARFYQDMPKIPASVVGQAWSFFKAVFAAKGSEAMAFITWDGTAYGLFVPPQTAHHAGVKAKVDTIPSGAALVGSIHSHCDFGAFHSGTDTHDADGHDGIHITLGHVNREDEPEIAIMASFSKIHFTLKPEDTIEGITLTAHPAEWLERVSKPEPPQAYTSPWIAGGHKPQPSKQTWFPKHHWNDWDDYLAYRYKSEPEPVSTKPAEEPSEDEYADLYIWAYDCEEQDETYDYWGIVADLEKLQDEINGLGWQLDFLLTRIPDTLETTTDAR